MIADTISDGQHLLSTSGTPNFTPTIEVNGNPYYLGTASFNSSNYIVSCDYTGATTTPPSECTVITGGATGDTTLTFNVSDEIITRLENGRMLGGCVNPAGGLYTPCDPVPPPGVPGDGPTTAIIVFQTQILEEFVDDYPSGDTSVDQGDELGNTAEVTGDVLDNSSFIFVGTEEDDAAAGVAIGREILSKSIFAINNEDDDTTWDRDSLGRVRIKPGDKITYRLTYGLLTSDVEELTFDDYFPLPVFDVDDPDEDGTGGHIWTFTESVPYPHGCPDPGAVTLLLPSDPVNGDTFFQYMTAGLLSGEGILSPSIYNTTPTQEPVITSDSAANKINIYYADYDDTRNLSTTVDLLFSLVVSDDPFADGLYLTNMAHAFEGSTNAGTSSSDAIIQFVINEPVLVSQKGIVWTSNSNASFTPTDVGPAGVAFHEPTHGTVPPRWTGTISSDGLAANPIDSNVTGVDAEDKLTFAITIENQGNSLKGAFDIQLRDIIDTAYYLTPVTGADLNLQVYYGDRTGDPDNPGNPIQYRALDPANPCVSAGNGDDCGLELFEEGIELIDPADPDQGICQTHDQYAGNNVILITYDLVIKPDVIPGQAINTVSMMNYAGSEGGPNHLPEDQEDDATADVAAELLKTLENTEIISGTNDLDEVVIGELVTYKISAVVPEGEVPNARLVDHLDGGLAFVSCTSVIAYSDTAVTTDVTTDLLSGSDFSGVCGTTEASGVTNFGQDIIFDLGNITNINRDNSDQERVEIIYQVVVLNVPGNQALTILDNAAEYLMNDGSGDVSLGTADAEDVTVIEPLLQVTKTAMPNTGDSGDTITFTIDLAYDGNSETTAFDVVLEDVIPADMTYVGSSISCTTAGGLAIPDTCAESGGTITVDWLGAVKPFESGYSATIEFDVTLDVTVTPGEVITNTADLTWTSLAGDETLPRSTYNTLSVERTGDNIGPGGAANDYLDSGDVDVTIFSPTADKIITGTNQTFTIGNDVAIGEQVSYRSSFIIPEGTSTSAQLVDTLDQGLAFVSCDNVYVTETTPGSLTTTGSFDCSSVVFSDHPNSNPDNQGRRMALDLGVVTNSDTNNGTDESITVEYTVVVINGGSNDRGDDRNNNAVWYWDGDSTSDSADNVTIVEPELQVTKTAVPDTGDYGDTITFTIDLQHSGLSNVNAYEIVLEDVIPADMTYVGSSLSCTPAGGLATPDTCSESGETITVEWLGAGKPFETTHSATIEFQVTLDLTVTPGEVITNDADLTWTSLPGNVSSAQSTHNPLSVERTGDIGDIGGVVNDYSATDDADVTIFSPTADKDILSTNQTFTIGNDVAIGEQITYQANFIIPEGTSTSAQLIDTLDQGLAFVSCDDVTVTGSLNATQPMDCSSAVFSDYPDSNPDNQGRRMTIDLGVVTNSDTNNATDESITVEYTVVVINGGSNDRGDNRNNDATWTWDGDSTSDSADNVTIVEPELQITKTAAPITGDSGDTISFTIDLQHSGVSNIDAYEIVLTDVIPAGLSFIPFSLSCTPAGGLAVPDTCSESGGTITVEWLGEGKPFETTYSATIEFQVTLDDTVNPAEVITNDADLTWTSLPGDVSSAQSTHNPLSVERTGDTGDIGGVVNDYSATDDADVTIPDIDLDKTISPIEYTIGEILTYDLEITLPEGTTNGLIVIDNLPLGLAYVSHNVDSSGYGGSLNASPGVSVTPGSGGDLTLNFGNTLTTSDNNSNNNSFFVEVTVQVLNEAINVDGASLQNTGRVQHDDGPDVTDFVDIFIIEPLLTVGKSVDDSTPALGQTITYTLVIAHDLDGIGEDSHSPAYDVNLVDTLPTGLSNLTSIGSSSNPGGCAAGINTTASTASELNVTIDSIHYQLPSPGCVVTITFDATVDNSPSPTTPAVGSTIDNTADIIWTSITGSDANERFGDGVAGGLNDYENDDTEAITITNPDLRVTKDDGVAFYVPGLTVVYDIVVENVGNEDVIAALVEDDIPPQLSSWDWACNGTTGGASGCDGVAGSSVNFSDFVDLPAGSSLTYQVTANILSSATGNMTNTVTVTMPAGYIEPTPDDNTDSDTDVQESQADLSVSKDDGVTLISPGTTITYTIVVSNLSPSDVWGAEVTDSIPAEIDSWTWVCTGTTGGASGCTPAPNSALDFSDTVDLPASSSITYSVTAQVSAGASGTLTNEVTVTAPAGVTETDLDNNTDDDVDGFPENNKALVDQQHGVTSLPDVAIGEVLTYEVVLTMPVGSMTALHLIDTLDRGLAFVSCEVITGPGLTTNGSASFSAVCTSPDVSTYPSGSTDDEDLGRQVDFNFGTLANNSAGEADLTVRYQVVVLDSLENQGSGSTPPLNNQAEWIWDSGQFSDQAVGVLILEPDLTLTKDVDSTVAYPGQLLTFTLVIDHSLASETSAFDLELTDIIPDGLIYQPPIRHIAGQAPDQIIDAGAPTLIIRWLEFENFGVNSVLEIDVLLDSEFRLTKHNQSITNEASLSWTSLPGDFSSAQSTHNPLSTERYYDPLSNVNIYGTGDSARIRIPALPDTGFAPGKVTPLPIQSDNQTYGAMDGLQIEIPKLNLSVPIVSVQQSEQGWDLTWLWNQAGWLEGTAYPSWYGNTVITGHAYLPNGLPGPFVDLGTLSWGDEIILYANGLKYTYQVRVRDLVSADDLSILEHKDQDWLTLFTCKEYSEILDEYLWRQVVQAVLIDVEQFD